MCTYQVISLLDHPAQSLHFPTLFMSQALRKRLRRRRGQSWTSRGMTDTASISSGRGWEGAAFGMSFKLSLPSLASNLSLMWKALIHSQHAKSKQESDHLNVSLWTLNPPQRKSLCCPLLSPLYFYSILAKCVPLDTMLDTMYSFRGVQTAATLPAKAAATT